MSSFSGDWQLRKLAIRQLEHDRRTHAEDEYREFERDEQVAVRHGHISPRFFYGCDEEFADLPAGQPIHIGLILAKAKKMMRQWIELGPHKGGFLTEYAVQSLDHLERCPGCQERVVAQIMEELSEISHIRELLAPFRDQR